MVYLYFILGGGFCNFMHLKHISRSFKKELYKEMNEKFPEYKEKMKKRKRRRRSRSRDRHNRHSGRRRYGRDRRRRSRSRSRSLSDEVRKMMNSEERRK
jgi:splicing factor U2AF subunit